MLAVVGCHGGHSNLRGNVTARSGNLTRISWAKG
jgi:hypothetical protein